MAKRSRFLAKFGVAGRPVHPDWGSFSSAYNRPTVLQRPEVGEEIGLADLYDLARRNNAVGRSVQAIVDYLFINRYRWEKKWGRRCKQCGGESPPDVSPSFCPKCHHGADWAGPIVPGATSPLVLESPPNMWLPTKDDGGAAAEMLPGIDAVAPGGMYAQPPKWYDEPNEDEVKLVEDFFEFVDAQGHSIVETLKIFERHLNVCDDGFLVANPDYGLSPEGDIMDWRPPTEIIVADPQTFGMVVDTATRLPKPFYICLRHRPKSRLRKDDPTANREASGPVAHKPGKCQMDGCGMRLHPATYVSHEPGGKDNIVDYFLGPQRLQDGTLFPGEVIHSSKYGHDYGYGWSPTFRIYDRAKLLDYMERFMRTFYENQRMPRRMIAFPVRGGDPNAIRPVVDAMKDRNVSDEGHYMPPLVYDPAEGSHRPETIDLVSLPQEMEFSKVMEDCYIRVGMAYGVEPIFQGTAQAVGSNNSGPTQWQVTMDAAKLGQSVYNEKVFPALLKLMKIKDWKLVLNEVEERDDAQGWQNKILEANYAAILKNQLGFPILGRDIEGHIEIGEKPTADPMAGGMGGPGGPMGGGLGGGDLGGGGIDDLPPAEPGDRGPPEIPGFREGRDVRDKI